MVHRLSVDIGMFSNRRSHDVLWMVKNRMRTNFSQVYFRIRHFKRKPIIHRYAHFPNTFRAFDPLYS